MFLCFCRFQEKLLGVLFFYFQGQGQRLKVKYLECIRPMDVSQFMVNILQKLCLNFVISKQKTFWQILMDISSDLENSIRNDKVVYSKNGRKTSKTVRKTYQKCLEPICKHKPAINMIVSRS